MSIPTVLIADDDAGMVRMIKTTLEPLGLRIRDVRDAFSALMEVHESPPDLVILDVNMPAGNGLSVCEMLATNPGLRRLPVIMLTGDPSEEVRERCMDMGADFVPKGTEAMFQLKRLVSQILSDHESEATKSQMFIG